MSRLRVEKHGEIAAIRLGAGAALDAALLAELDAAAQELHDDTALLAALLTGERDAFALEADGPPEGGAAFRSLETLRVPVIACIEGAARGAGLELALACDLRIASEDATFALGDVAAGRVPALGGTQRLPRLAGRAKALEVILLGAELSASDALACGLVNHVVPAGAARERGLELARSIAARGPIAIAYAKEAVLRGLDMPLEQALRYETDLTIILQTTADRDEGVRAFLDKRPPRFRGE